VFAFIKTLKNKDVVHAKDDYTSLKTLKTFTTSCGERSRNPSIRSQRHSSLF